MRKVAGRHQAVSVDIHTASPQSINMLQYSAYTAYTAYTCALRGHVDSIAVIASYRVLCIVIDRKSVV